jgi:hypothetical protein
MTKISLPIMLCIAVITACSNSNSKEHLYASATEDKVASLVQKTAEKAKAFTPDAQSPKYAYKDEIAFKVTIDSGICKVHEATISYDLQDSTCNEGKKPLMFFKSGKHTTFWVLLSDVPDSVNSNNFRKYIAALAE